MKNKIKKEEGPKKRNGILLVILLATVFGLGAGIVSGFIIKPYILRDVYNIPFSGEIDFSQASLRKANLIIENAKKIIVEQDSKVTETINSAKASLVGIFESKEKKAISTSSPADEITDKEGELEKFDIDDYYKIDERIAQGIIITSDGWILVNDFKKNLSINYLIKNYLIITKDNEIYKIDEIIKLENYPYLFIHAKEAKELPVKNFAPKNTLTNGQLIIATDWDEKSCLSSIISKRGELPLIMSSDKVISGLVLADNLENYFQNAFIFNLNGEIIGLFNKDEGLFPIDYFQPIINSLLGKKSIKRPALGVNYINLSDFAILKEGFDKGALLYSGGDTPAVEKGSAAEESGLREGDIIISVDNIEIDKNNDLADIIQGYLAGDEINIIYLRAGKEEITKVKLDEYENKID